MIKRHKELFEATTLEERKQAYDRVTNFFKDVPPIDFEKVRTEGILKK